MKKLIATLMLRTSFTNNLGLFNGKMGVALFFFAYNEYTKCKRYKSFAKKLIVEIYQDITPNCPLNFSDGICGIAFAFAYLIKHKYIDVEEDFFCDLDKKIREVNVLHLADKSISDGLAGIGCYIVGRLSMDEKYGKLPNSYIDEIKKSLLNSNNDTCFQILNYINSVESSDESYIDIIMNKFVLPLKIPVKNNEIGLHNGLSGYCFSIIKNKHYDYCCF